MDGSALRDDDAGGKPAPGWADVRQAVMIAAEVCASAAVSVAMRGPHGVHAALMVRQLSEGLRDLSAQLRPLAFDEAVVDAERERAAAEALGAAGVVAVAAPRPRHLHSVS